MSKKAACKCKQEECEECPEWIFTFADLVMLMMGFFVILWVLKPAPGKADTPEANEEWIKLAAKIREAFDYLPDPQSTDPVDQEMLIQKLQQMKPLNDAVTRMLDAQLGPGSGDALVPDIELPPRRPGRRRQNQWAAIRLRIGDCPRRRAAPT